MPVHAFLWVYPVWSLLSFTNLWIYDKFLQIFLSAWVFLLPFRDFNDKKQQERQTRKSGCLSFSLAHWDLFPQSSPQKARAFSGVLLPVSTAQFCIGVTLESKLDDIGENKTAKLTFIIDRSLSFGSLVQLAPMINSSWFPSNCFLICWEFLAAIVGERGCSRLAPTGTSGKSESIIFDFIKKINNVSCACFHINNADLLCSF